MVPSDLVNVTSPIQNDLSAEATQEGDQNVIISVTEKKKVSKCNGHSFCCVDLSGKTRISCLVSRGQQTL